MLALAECSVPRYTSYPTAPHFSADIGPQIYADWLDALPEAATLSIYLHVPFCTELCRYCGCTTKAVRRRPPADAYAELLHTEIELLKCGYSRASRRSSPLGRRHAINPRRQPSRSPRRQVDHDLRLRAPPGTCNRARSAPPRCRLGLDTCPHTRNASKPGGARFLTACPTGDRPPPTVRAG
jgi:hypothetical protein